MTSIATTIGFIAALLTTVAFLPQALKVWQTRSAKDVSLGMYMLFTLGVALWLIYGVLLVLLMMVKPQGLLGDINFKYIRQRMEHREKSKEAANE